ncbi:MAG: prepilin-type N-terminal cleavage/methylation domain-containing protein [Paeniclostridium sordellii]|nr:prepilin-type N-terminal cleavage/methylation domain-containing protein [Paeniclostridium sordellii]
MKKKNNKGFTLIELLVVIAIIGILAVVAVPALFKNIEKAKIADLESDISAIKSASLAYYSDNSIYPTGDIYKDKDDDITATPGSTAEKIVKEVENLSFPFDGTYKIGMGTDEIDKKDVVLTLVGGKSLSEDGFDKLKKDLGTGIVHGEAAQPEFILIKGN